MKAPASFITTFMSVSRFGVLGVVEVEHRAAAEDADRDGDDLPVQRARRDELRALQPRDRVRERDVAAADGRGARAAVGLQHVAVDDDGALAERLHVERAAQRASDEPLYLHAASLLAAAHGLAVGARRRRARQHAVLRGDPALAAAATPRRHAILDGRRAQDLGVAELDEHRAFRVLGESAPEADATQLIVGTAARAHGS